MTMGIAFMGFLKGVGSILGIWFLIGLLQVMSKREGCFLNKAPLLIFKNPYKKTHFFRLYNPC